MERVILHSDMNNCYASIELLYNPQWRGVPLIVGGDPQARHGIVLAKDQLAKKAGVKTGMAQWEAKQACPGARIVRPHMDLYLKFSRLAHEIYASYTDQVEPFGIDESWLDVTASRACRGDGETIAQEIRERMKEELGVTVSVGVSWNKIFAKLGSDYKKPDAVTVITRENWKDVVWPLPAGDLLYVGPATRRALEQRRIFTIGELAQADPELLQLVFGKMGLVLHVFANGLDQTPVEADGWEAPVKSIGNSVTTPRDMVTRQDISVMICALADTVSTRLRLHGFWARRVTLWLRDSGLHGSTKQCRLPKPTDISGEIGAAAMRLVDEAWDGRMPLRSIGVRAGDLITAGSPVQRDLFTDEEAREKHRRLDRAVDEIRVRFGAGSIRRCLQDLDPTLRDIHSREEHLVHPRGYFENGNRTGAGEEEQHGTDGDETVRVRHRGA